MECKSQASLSAAFTELSRCRAAMFGGQSRVVHKNTVTWLVLNVPTASTYHANNHISAAINTLLPERVGVWKAIVVGLHPTGERDVAEIEFPKQPPMLDEILRRSLTDDNHPRRYGAGAVAYDASGDVAGNEFGARNHHEVAMNSGTNINLRKLQEHLDRQPLDEIALLVRALTYGEMIELAEGMWKVQPEGSAVTQENLPALLHRWSQSRTLPSADYTHQDQDAE